MMPSYPATLDFLYGLQQHGIKLGLHTVHALLDRMDRPQNRYLSIHIGGTNGKGSTAAIVASILQAAGHRVGLYTSPHLIDFRERIRVDSLPISEDAVCRMTERVREAMGSHLSPTFFEFTTAMAFEHFARTGVQVAVLEVGMGGRFDATNVVGPVAAGITNVGLDHMQYLGSTLASIAEEKAGILKPHVPAAVGKLEEPARVGIRQVASAREAPLYELERDFHYDGEDPSCFRYRGLDVTWDGLSCPLQGRHQLENAACGLALIELAGVRGLPVGEEAVRQGLSSVSWEGRLEIAETNPFLLLDGAHNPAAAEAVVRYVRQFRQSHRDARVILVLGMMRDKDRDGFIGTLLPEADEVVLTEPNIARAASVSDLSSSLGHRAGSAHCAPVPADALACARRLAAPCDLICVTGSLMLVGDVKALLRGCGLSPIRG